MGWERDRTLNPTIDRLLLAAHGELGGQLWTKVCLAGDGVGPWPKNTPGLYLDAAWLPHGTREVRSWADDPSAFDQTLGDATAVTAVVARGYADRTVFGLLLAAQDLIGLEWPDLPCPVGGLAVSTPDGHDPNMDWVYHRHSFEVIEISEEVGR